MILDAFRLDGKFALITGAARGLGQAMAVGLAEAGADIVGIDVISIVYALGQPVLEVNRCQLRG